MATNDSRIWLNCKILERHLYNGGMDDERDIERSEGEGMVIHDEYIPGGVSFETHRFIFRVLDKFRQNKGFEDVGQAASAVLEGMDEEEKKRIEKDDVRGVIRRVVSKYEWEEMENEECSRTLERDAQDAGLGG